MIFIDRTKEDEEIARKRMLQLQKNEDRKILYWIGGTAATGAIAGFSYSLGQGQGFEWGTLYNMGIGVLIMWFLIGWAAMLRGE